MVMDHRCGLRGKWERMGEELTKGSGTWILPGGSDGESRKGNPFGPTKGWVSGSTEMNEVKEFASCHQFHSKEGERDWSPGVSRGPTGLWGFKVLGRERNRRGGSRGWASG